MSFHKKTVIRTTICVGIVSTALIFTACSNNDPSPGRIKPMNTAGKSPNFILGAEDGCTTANGDYTKNHKAFNNDIEYHEGWFAGRRYCQI